MLRILHCVNNMHRAGLETMLMNYYRNIDRTKIQFDFLMHREERSDYDDEIEALGGRIFRAPRLFPHNYPSYFRYMKKFFAEHPEYKIVHSHIDAMSYLPLLAAEKAGVPIRIAHSHNTGIDRDYKYLLKQYFRYNIKNVATEFFACGNNAGDFLFRGSSYKVIHNAVDPTQFYFDENTRKTKREELGISDEFVIGHVGRMAYAKNHEYLLEIFSQILLKNPKCLLLLIGTGEKEEQLKEKAAKLGVASSVCFLGNRTDVNELYQVMDVFVLPSFFEGIPLVGVEAQFSGLPCVFSTGVPAEVAFNESCSFKSLSDSVSDWCDEIISSSENVNRKAVNENSPYDIQGEVMKLQDFYSNFIKGYEDNEYF